MKKIVLSQGKKAIIDDDDFDEISKFKWTMHSEGYAYRMIYYPDHQKCVLLHRLIMKAVKGQEVDHLNGNKLDNRKKNLRFCTSGENKANQKIRADNTTGHKGVWQDKRNGRYYAYINFQGKRYCLKGYATAKEAATAYNQKALELYGSFARLNDE